MKIDGIASVNDAVGDGGAVHDASEHIDEDGFDPEYKIKINDCVVHSTLDL